MVDNIGKVWNIFKVQLRDQTFIIADAQLPLDIHNRSSLKICFIFNKTAFYNKYFPFHLIIQIIQQYLTINLYQGLGGGDRWDLPKCRFYNNFRLILPSTVCPKIYNLQYTVKIWLNSTIFAQKPKMQSANLQYFGLWVVSYL